MALGFSAHDVETLLAHFGDAEARGKAGHGYARIPWLETLPALDPSARPRLLIEEPGYERWDGGGALGYLVLAAVVEHQLDRPTRGRLVVAERCFPTGVLGYWTRLLAEGGLVAALTATSPRRLANPDGGPPLAGTNPLAIGIPSSDGNPIVADVSPAMEISRAELFGPAVAVSAVDGIEEAIELANTSEYGLGAGIFTSDVTNALRFALAVECGNIQINNTPLWRADLMPYGGLKGSGIGKEGPRYAIEEMTELKSVVFHGIGVNGR